MEEEKNPLDPRTEFTIRHQDLIKITQCKVHAWEKRTENEIYCPVCESAAIISPKDMKLYI